MTTVGVLALQGDVREHAAAVTALGATAVSVRRPHELDGCDAFIVPGGESTTIDKLLRAFELFAPLQQRLREGMPVLGSCAGMILMARDLANPAQDQHTLDIIDMTVRRNAFGRQVDSAEIPVVWRDAQETMLATFIRAPWVERVGNDVEVLATVRYAGEERIVAVREGTALATAFHPEVTDDRRVHRMLLDMASSTS